MDPTRQNKREIDEGQLLKVLDLFGFYVWAAGAAETLKLSNLAL